MLEVTPTEDTSWLHITIIPPTAQREGRQKEQQVIKPAKKNVGPTQKQSGEHEPEVNTETENPEYAITKENICKLTKEITASRKRQKI